VTRPYWAFAALVLAGLLGFGVYSCRNRQIVQQQTIQANDHHTAGTIHEQAAENLKPELDKAKLDVARLKAELAKLRAGSGSPPHPGVSVPPVEPGGLENVGPGVEGVGNGALQQIVAKQDEIIAAQDVQINGLETQVTNLTLRGDEYKAESASLRAVISHSPKRFNRAAGIEGGSDRSIAVWAEYDLGRIRTGLTVTRRPIETGSRTTLEASARIGWSF
jgi:hypothetical protein